MGTWARADAARLPMAWAVGTARSAMSQVDWGCSGPVSPGPRSQRAVGALEGGWCTAGGAAFAPSGADGEEPVRDRAPSVRCSFEA